MTARIIGAVSDDTIPANTLVRLTFGESVGWDYVGWFNSAFSSNFAGTYGKLAPLARVIPTTPDNVTSGETVAVIDANNKVERTIAEMVRSIESTVSSGVELRQVEVLSMMDKSVSSGAQGAQQRAGAREAETTAANAASWLTKTGAALGEGLSTLKWLAIAAIIIIIVIERRK